MYKTLIIWQFKNEVHLPPWKVYWIFQLDIDNYSASQLNVSKNFLKYHL